MLVDESRDHTGRARISSWPRRIARANFDERNFAFDVAPGCAGRMTISAVLLAGGESRRMGRDKATSIFEGMPLWRRQLELLRRLDAKEIFVSARTDPAWRPADVELVKDAEPSRGPLSGIAAALARMTSDHLLVLAIDLPFVTFEYFKNLCAQVELGRGIVPTVAARAEPLVAIYPREVVVVFQNALAGKNFSLQPLILRLVAAGQLRPDTIGPEKSNLFRNLNEPTDLQVS